MEAWLDGTHDPIWWQIWPPRYTDAEVFDAMDKLDNLIRERVAKQAPMALLVDVSRTRVGSPVQRKRISKTFRLTQSIARDLVICQAFVVRTRMQQGGLTATLWLFDPGWPLKFYRDRMTAQDWATTMVERFERQRWRDPPAV